MRGANGPATRPMGSRCSLTGQRRAAHRLEHHGRGDSASYRARRSGAADDAVHAAGDQVLRPGRREVERHHRAERALRDAPDVRPKARSRSASSARMPTASTIDSSWLRVVREDAQLVGAAGGEQRGAAAKSSALARTRSRRPCRRCTCRRAPCGGSPTASHSCSGDFERIEPCRRAPVGDMLSASPRTVVEKK